MKLIALAIAAGLATFAGAAQAMPTAPIHAPGGVVTEVGWRCGPGRHVTPRGYCVPNRIVARPFVYRTYRPARPGFYGYYRHPHPSWRYRY